MPTDREVLLLTGELQPGLSREAAAATLAQVLHVTQDQALQWLAGGEQVMRINVEWGNSFRICEALRAAGIGVRTHRMTAAEVAVATGDLERAAELRSDYSSSVAKELAVMSPQHAPAIAALAAKPMPSRPKLLPCPCCRNETLSRRGAGDECKRCGWCDYPEQSAEQNGHHPDRVMEGRNYGLSLDAARKVHERYGSIRPGDYVPNHVPLDRRVFNGVIAFLVIAYCGFSLWVGTMILPGGTGNKRPVHLEGMEVWLMAAALVAGAMYGVLAIVDHYDRRRNEHVYHKAVKASYVLMVVFMGLAMVVGGYREGGVWLALAVGFLALVMLVGTISNVTNQKVEY